MVALRMLSTLKKQSPEKKVRNNGESKALIFIDAMFKGIFAKSVMDTGAIHNFVSTTEVVRLGLVVDQDVGRMNAANSKSLPMSGLAKQVLIEIGTWKGRLDLIVVTMDDFDVVLGMDFLIEKGVIPIPSTGSLLIMGDKPTMISAKVKQPAEVKLLSALQFKKGVRKGDPTFMAIPVSVEKVGEEPITPEIEDVLKKFADVMPNSLPNILPPLRAVDHQIEMIPGAKPPARAPYRMAPPELAELQK